MSMNTYPFVEPAAFLVTEEVALTLNMKSENDTREISELSLEERKELSSTSLAHDVIEDIEGTVTFAEFEGNAISLYDRYVMHSDSPDEIEFHDDRIVLISCDRKPSLFRAAYADFDALVKEFSNTLHGLLPENFDVSKHIFMRFQDPIFHKSSISTQNLQDPPMWRVLLF